jgi:hypothetical protein
LQVSGDCILLAGGRVGNPPQDDILPHKPLALIRFQDLLAQADGLRRDFYEFVVANELDGLLQVEDARR